MKFFRSIRWRLVASYGLLTLLTVSLVGVLALSLIERYTQQQEIDYLTANAESVARQAAPLVDPLVRPFELAELAHTSAFLGNARVTILDARRQVLADSGPHTDVDELVWIATPSNQTFGSFIVSTPNKGMSMQTHLPNQIFCADQVPAGTRVTVIYRATGAWGIRFSFGREMPVSQAYGTDSQTLASETEALSSAAGTDDEWVGEALESESPRRTVTVPIRDEGNLLGYVQLSRGLNLSVEALGAARRAFLVAAAGAVSLAILLGLGVGQRLTAPLRKLSAAARRMGGGDLSTRASVSGRDEIGVLAGQFNLMAERLETSFAELAAERDALRRFIADASHELRTPITALKTFNELLLEAAAGDAQARAEFLAESQVQLERLDWITHNLLDLSRLDAGLTSLEIAEHDAGELVEAAGAAFKALAQDQGVTFSIRRPVEPLPLSCDRARIELALSNLLDNALKFAPPGGEVEAGAEPSEAGVRLWVRDSGPGIDPNDLPHVFERFYRGRNGDQDSVRGNGLGLAIVQSVVQAHGGQVSVQSQPGAGSLFEIELPHAA